MFRSRRLGLGLLVLAFGGRAELRSEDRATIRIVTERLPPFNYDDGPVVRGASTAVVREVMSRAGVRYTIEVVPGDGLSTRASGRPASSGPCSGSAAPETRRGRPSRCATSPRPLSSWPRTTTTSGRKIDFRGVRIERDLDPATHVVDCTPTELVQVVFNIVRNAAEALGAGTCEDPTITVRTRREGDFARLEIRDNGPGMDERTRRRVFEPYFSTKGPGGERASASPSRTSS